MEKQRERGMDKVRRLFAWADGLRGVKAWLTLLGIAVLSYLLVLMPFLLRGTYTVWTESAGDAATQGVTFLAHVKEMGWLKAIGDYDFYMGLGADYLTSLSFFSLFDPFNLLFFALPGGDLMKYTLVMACKQLATALTMFAYLRYKKVRNSCGMILSIAYMLTGFTAFTFVRHYNLTAGPIYFPLAILGVEKCFHKERPYLFVATVFLCLLTNFYVFFSMSVFLVAYAVAFYFYHAGQSGTKASVKNFFVTLLPIGGLYLLGVALAGFMLFPNLYGYLNAARSASKGLRLFVPEIFLGQLASLTLPSPGGNYSSMWVNAALAALALFAIYKKEKSTRIYAWFVVVLTIGYLVPAFGYAMNIFNYCNNRWSYGLSFFVFALIGMQSKEETPEEEYGEELQKKVNITFTIYLALMAGTALFALVSYLHFAAWWYLLPVVVACGVGYGCYRWIVYQKKRPVRKFFQKLYRPGVLYPLSFALVLLYCLGFYVPYCFQHNGVQRYGYLHSAQERFVASKIEEEGYFRADTKTTGDWYTAFTNRGVNNGYFGTSNYNSISNKYVYEFFKENGVYNPAQNLGVSGLDGRYALQNLLSVQYSYDIFGAPYGFTQVAGFDGLYENTKYAGMGFLLTKTYSKEEYLAQDVLARQAMLLSGVVLEEGEGNADGTWQYALAGETLAEKGSIDKGAPLRMTLDVSEYRGMELYIAVQGVREVEALTFVDVTCNGATKEYYYATKGNLMYSEQRDFYLHFGMVESDQTDVELRVTRGGKLAFESVRLVAAPVVAEDTFSAFTAADRLQDVAYTGNSFGGRITAQSAGYMLLSLPYSEGWTAYVDGEKTEIVRANTAFMAIALTQGEHDVEFRYETPYLALGKTVSYCAIGALGLLIAVDSGLRIARYYKKKDGEEEEKPD